MHWDRVKPGENAGALSAGFLNAAMDHLEYPHAPPPGMRAQAGAGAGVNGSIELVRNDAGRALERYSVVGLNGLVIKPADNPDGWQHHVVLSAVAPTADGQFAVLLEPAEPGKIVQAVTAGGVPARVNALDEEHKFAVPVDDEFDHFDSAESGPVQIRELPTATGVYESYVHIGVGGVGAGGGDRLARMRSPGSGGWVDANEVVAFPEVSGGTNFTWSPSVIRSWYPVGEGRAP